MQVAGKVVVVTGGGNGIGRALCEAFHRAGAARVVVADIDPNAARAVAGPSTARPSNAMSARRRTSSTSSRRPRTSSARSRCSAPMPVSAAASIRCRSMPAAIPTSRGSAAGPSMSWRMSMRRGIWSRATRRAAAAISSTRFPRRACCRRSAARPIPPPNMPRWDLRKTSRSRTRPTTSRSRSSARRASTPTCCARSRRARNPATATCARAGRAGRARGLEQETFVILPHPQVLGYMRKKTENYDRWISGMAKIQAKMRETYGK